MTSASVEQQVHITPVKAYLGVFLALIVLTAVTVMVASYDFGSWNIVIALAIASIKALLVVFIFMHLYHDNKLYFLIFIIALMFLTLFLVFTMFDTNHRADIYKIKTQKIKQNAAIYDNKAITLDSVSDTTSSLDSVVAKTPKNH